MIPKNGQPGDAELITLAIAALGAAYFLAVALRPEFVLRCEPLPLHRRFLAHVRHTRTTLRRGSLRLRGSLGNWPR